MKSNSVAVTICLFAVALFVASLTAATASARTLVCPDGTNVNLTQKIVRAEGAIVVGGVKYVGRWANVKPGDIGVCWGGPHEFYYIPGMIVLYHCQNGYYFDKNIDGYCR